MLCCSMTTCSGGTVHCEQHVEDGPALLKPSSISPAAIVEQGQTFLPSCHPQGAQCAVCLQELGFKAFWGFLLVASWGDESLGIGLGDVSRWRKALSLSTTQ